MSTYVLIPGAGGAAWYWSRLAPLLRGAGHEAIAVDLPGDDDVAAIGDRGDVVVAQSLGGFTAAMTAGHAGVRSLTFVNAMIADPGERPGAWWANAGALDARVAAAAAGGYGGFDLATYFLHDVPPEIASEGERHQRPEADAVFASPCDFGSWPPIPTRVLCGSADRFFPLQFQRTVARRRLGI